MYYSTHWYKITLCFNKYIITVTLFVVFSRRCSRRADMSRAHPRYGLHLLKTNKHNNNSATLTHEFILTSSTADNVKQHLLEAQPGYLLPPHLHAVGRAERTAPGDHVRTQDPPSSYSISLDWKVKLSFIWTFFVLRL